MIIACPNCTKPYQLPDEQVAPLVQVQCAHCDYRVIYDFEAANDPSLREPEMLLADGFRSEPSNARPMRRRFVTSTRGSRCSRPWNYPPISARRCSAT